MPGEITDTGNRYALEAVDGRAGYTAVTITSTSSGTITTSGSHGLSVGQIIYIAGATTAPATGQYIVLTVPTASTLTVGSWTTGATSLPSAIATTGTAGTISYYKPARLTYLALYTTTLPTDNTTDGTIITTSEYAATGYARQPVFWGAPAQNAIPTPEVANATVLTFGPFTASVTGTIQYAGLVTAATGSVGDLLAIWTLDNARTPAVNDSISIAVGALKLSSD